MERTKRNYLIGLTLLTAISGGVVDLLLKEVFPQAYFEAYPLIPLYFFLLELLVFYILYRRRDTRQAPLWLMALKMVKFVLSALVAVAYCLLVGHHVKEFLLVFVFFYLLYLVYETIFFARKGGGKETS
ncbi:MAG: hypothetical protein LBN29_03590 [Mediterranea sp.]|jgi:zinc transporter ZupT|nr:hypothetical protein [Mediterranea sp.]